MQTKRKLSFSTLKAIGEVYRRGSVSEASTALGISQPAISMHMRRFEEYLGFPVIERVGNRLVFHSKECGELVQAILDSESALRRLKNYRADGFQRIGICSSLGLGSLASRVLANSTEEKLLIYSDDAEHLTKQIKQKFLSAMVVVTRRADESPIVKRSVSFMLAAPRADHGVTNQRRQRLRLVLISNRLPLGSAVNDWLSSTGLEYDVVAEVSSVTGLLEVCSRMGAQTVIPNLPGLKAHFHQLSLAGMRDDGPPLEIGIVADERRLPILQAERLLDRLVG